MATDYMLVMAGMEEGLPEVCGALVAEDQPGGVHGEAAIGDGVDVDPYVKAAAVALLRGLPAVGSDTAVEWMRGLDGVANGRVRLVGPWRWDAELREVLPWALDSAGLTAMTVALVRDGVVEPNPNDI